jgi:exosome complex RNA-binding protein Csl4
MKHTLCLTMFILLPVLGYSQEKTVYGRVTDVNKQSIPFCVVQLKGRNEGVYSDDKGNFSIKVNSDSVKTLIFYCMGAFPVQHLLSN